MDILASVYLFCLVFGGGFFLITSLFAGGHHHVHHGDIGGLGHSVSGFLGHHGLHISGHDHDVEAINPLNLRNILAFIAIFGLVGTIAVQMMRISLIMSLFFSIPAGIVAGAFSWLTLLFAVSRQATSQAKKEDFIHQVGEVSVAIPEKGLGEINVVIKGQLKGLLARSYTGKALKKGEEVTIVRYEPHDVVAVVPLDIINE